MPNEDLPSHLPPMKAGPTAAPAAVRHRRVYYFGGFDTRSARFYHGLYQAEAAAQQAVNVCTYEVGPMVVQGERMVAWSVQAQDGEQRVSTDYRFMQWSDIIRAHWPSSIWRVAATVPGFFWRYTASGALRSTWRLSRPFFWMLVLPLLMTLAALLLGAAAAALVAWVWPASLPGRAWAALGGGLLLVALGLWHTERLRIFWLMRAWPFLWSWIRQDLPALATRCDEFAQVVEADLQGDTADEVLLIGHSAGAMMALSVAARWLAGRSPDRPPPPRVKLLTLGSVHPFLGLVAEGGWYREEMARVAAAGMVWVDYTAPADPVCYALVNPLLACGLPESKAANYRAKSARFDRMFAPERYAELRRDFFRIHFQYLMATDRPVDNDYFRLTAGPLPLSAGPGGG